MEHDNEDTTNSEASVGNAPITEEEIFDGNADDVFSLLESESDRGAVLVGLALLDSEVENLIRVKFDVASVRYIESLDFERYEGDLVQLIKQQERVRKNLLKHPGLLSSVAAKLDLAFCMGWLSEDCYHDLVQIRKLRNTAAHSVGRVDLFGDLQTRALLTSLRTTSDDIRQGMAHPAAYRSAFIWVIIELHLKIMDAILHEYQIAKGVNVRNRSKADQLLNNLDKVIQDLHHSKNSPKNSPRSERTTISANVPGAATSNAPKKS